MKVLRSLTLMLLLPFLSIAQQKKLTIEEAVLKQRTTLAPEKLNQPMWIPGTNIFTFIGKKNGKDCLVKEDAVTLKQDTILSIDVFKEGSYHHDILAFEVHIIHG